MNIACEYARVILKKKFENSNEKYKNNKKKFNEKEFSTMNQ